MGVKREGARERGLWTRRGSRSLNGEGQRGAIQLQGQGGQRGEQRPERCGRCAPGAPKLEKEREAAGLANEGSKWRNGSYVVDRVLPLLE